MEKSDSVSQVGEFSHFANVMGMLPLILFIISLPLYIRKLL